MGLCVMLAWCALLTGCISASLDHVEEVDGFDWNTLKRDEILISPLIDLRALTPAEKVEPRFDFFSVEKAMKYAQTFKESFFKMRKDIRMFGEGGAFEYLVKVDGLKEVALQAMARQPLSVEMRDKIVAGSQGIRFVFFFVITREWYEQKFDYFRNAYWDAACLTI